MIVGFKHKGLERFYLTGNMAGVLQAPRHLLRLYLACLDSVFSEEDLLLPETNLSLLSDGRWCWQTPCGVFYWQMQYLQMIDLDFVVE